MIYEMNLEKEYKNEIDFLIKESKKIMLEDKNLDSLKSYDLNNIKWEKPE